MKIVFLDNQNKNKSKKYGPFKSVTLMNEWLVGDNDEIAIFDKHNSGMWQIKEDCTKWTEVKIE